VLVVICTITAKAFVPAANVGGPVLFEAPSITPLIGDPAAPDYDQRIPDFEAPLVVVLGIVDGPLRGPPNGVISCPIWVSDYVRGGKMECISCKYNVPNVSPPPSTPHSSCRLDRRTGRWRNFATLAPKKLHNPRPPNGEILGCAPSLETTAFVAPTPQSGDRDRIKRCGTLVSLFFLLRMQTSTSASHRSQPASDSMALVALSILENGTLSALGVIGARNFAPESPASSATLLEPRPGHRHCGDPVHALEGQVQGTRLTLLINRCHEKIQTCVLRSCIITVIEFCPCIVTRMCSRESLHKTVVMMCNHI
jgi:hypothetical protein